uniref:Uncharacterized protein n=1 Tax=viral metagenome TaxID=1070528 RepID=A0A6C0BJJ1_9ZZZZ
MLLYNKIKTWASTVDLKSVEAKETLRFLAEKHTSKFVGLTMKEIEGVGKKQLDQLMSIYNMVLTSDNEFLKAFSTELKSSLNKINPSVYDELFRKRIMNIKKGGSYDMGSQVGGKGEYISIAILIMLSIIMPVLYGVREPTLYSDLPVLGWLFKTTDHFPTMPRAVLGPGLLRNASKILESSDRLQHMIEAERETYMAALDTARVSAAATSSAYGTLVGYGSEHIPSGRSAEGRLLQQAFAPFLEAEQSLTRGYEDIGGLLANKVIAEARDVSHKALSWLTYKAWTQQERDDARAAAEKLKSITDKLETQSTRVEAFKAVAKVSKPSTAISIHGAIGAALRNRVFEDPKSHVVQLLAPSIARNGKKIITTAEELLRKAQEKEEKQLKLRDKALELKTARNRIVEQRVAEARQINITTRSEVELRERVSTNAIALANAKAALSAAAEEESEDTYNELKRLTAARDAAADALRKSTAALPKSAKPSETASALRSLPKSNLNQQYRSATESFAVADAAYQTAEELYNSSRQNVSLAEEYLAKIHGMVDTAKAVVSGVNLASISRDLVPAGQNFEGALQEQPHYRKGLFGNTGGFDTEISVHGIVIRLRLPQDDALVNFDMNPNMLLRYVDMMFDTELVLADIGAATGTSVDMLKIEQYVCNGQGGCKGSPIMESLLKTFISHAAEVALSNSRLKLSSLQSAQNNFTITAASDEIDKIANGIANAAMVYGGTEGLLKGIARRFVIDCYSQLGRRVPTEASYGIIGEIVYKTSTNKTLTPGELMRITDINTRLDILDLQNDTWFDGRLSISASHNRAFHRIGLLQADLLALFIFAAGCGAEVMNGVLFSQCRRFVRAIERQEAAEAAEAERIQELLNAEQLKKLAALRAPVASARPLPAGAAASNPLRNLAAAAADHASAVQRGGARFTRRRPRKQRRRISHATKRSARR